MFSYINKIKLLFDKFLEVVKPPYNITELRRNRYFAYSDHHSTMLRIAWLHSDLYFLFRYDGKQFVGVVILLIGESLLQGFKAFMNDKEKRVARASVKIETGFV